MQEKSVELNGFINQNSQYSPEKEFNSQNKSNYSQQDEQKSPYSIKLQNIQQQLQSQEKKVDNMIKLSAKKVIKTQDQIKDIQDENVIYVQNSSLAQSARKKFGKQRSITSSQQQNYNKIDNNNLNNKMQQTKFQIYQQQMQDAEISVSKSIKFQNQPLQVSQILNNKINNNQSQNNKQIKPSILQNSKYNNNQNNDKNQYSPYQSNIGSSVIQQSTKLTQRTTNRSPFKNNFLNNDTENIMHKIDYDSIYLQPNYLYQDEAVLKLVLKGEQTYCSDQPKILKNWIMSLPQDTRQEIEKDRTFFPVPRNLMPHQLKKEIEQLYGVGQNRILRPGEEAIIIQTIESILQEAEKNLNIITQNGLQSMIRKIIKKADLEDTILQCPNCMKQVEYHWKIMATRFRCNQKANFASKKNAGKAISAQQRGHFLNLNDRSNILVQFLLKYSQEDYELFDRQESVTLNNNTNNIFQESIEIDEEDDIFS